MDDIMRRYVASLRWELAQLDDEIERTFRRLAELQHEKAARITALGSALDSVQRKHSEGDA